MKDIGKTSAKGCNYPNTPKAGPSAPGPKTTDGGVSLSKGYNTIGENGMSPRAVTVND